MTTRPPEELQDGVPATASRRWIRLDVGWSDSAWVSALRPAARLAWVELLGYVKRDGVLGRVKALSVAALARKVRIGPTDVRAMLEAAVIDDAVRPDGDDWVITHWDDYQSPDRGAAERMRRMRQRRSYGVTGRNARNSDPPPLASPPTRTETETGENPPFRVPPLPGGRPNGSHRWRFVPADWQPKDRHHRRAAELGISLDREVAKFRAHEYERPKSDADRAFDKWLEIAPRFERRTRNGRRTQSEVDADLMRQRQELETVDIVNSRSPLQ